MNNPLPDKSFPRFGVEEEFFVVDPVTRAVVPQAESVLNAATKWLESRAAGEITKFQVEARTEPCQTLDEIHSQLSEQRQALADAATTEGLQIIASGSPVLGNFIPPPITEGPRQAKGTATFRGLHDDLAICALHVHVEMLDREKALMMSNHLRPYLPVLISLAANSPYWAEKDTGYASWRTMTWNRWPVAGPPPYFTSAAHYDRLVETMQEAGALVDKGTIFWDIRPSAHQSTLEIRACDMPMTADESAMIAALVRAMVVTLMPEVEQGNPGPAVPAEMMRVAYWRAARDGIDGHGIDVHTGQSLPAAEMAHRVLRMTRPVLEEQGEFDRVSGWLRRMLDSGDGAMRQRASAARRGLLTDVVDDLIARTAPHSSVES